MPNRRLILTAFLPVLVACGGDGTTPVTPSQPLGSSTVASVAVTPQTVLLAAGDTVRLTATTRDISGTLLGGRRVVWSSEAPDFVSVVSSTGLVTALAKGRSVRITATSEGVSSAATVTTPN
jgi:uncharacterized protein YjdB